MRGIAMLVSDPTGEALAALQLLNASGATQATLHRRARELRDEVFGRNVFVRGVVEVSNFCRQNCNYCAMRRDNRDLERYRLAVDTALDLVLNHRPACITDIDIQAGEDPVAVRDIVIPLVRELRRQTNLGITLCLGTLAHHEYDELRASGGDYYILKLESGDAAHYETIEAPGTMLERLEAIRYLASRGWNVSSGLIVGLPGQADEHIMKTLELLGELPLAGASVSPFIAGPQTPFDSLPNGDLELTLNCLAMMRLASPHWIIPAVSAIKLVGDNGYTRAFDAGANLATINLTPTMYRNNYPIYRRDRIIMDEAHVLAAVAEAGCTVSTTGMSEFLSRRSAVSACSDQ